MWTVFGSLDRIQVYEIEGLLRSAGIPCRIQNEFLGQAMGDVPWNMCTLELSVDRAEDVDRARKLIEDFTRPVPKNNETWQCPICGEPLEGQFSNCWKCAAPK